MTIVLASDDGFVPQLAVTLISILENNRDQTDLTVYVLSLHIAQSNQALLEQMVASYDCHLEFIALDDIESYYPYPIDTGRFKPIILGRLFIARLLPVSLERVLYMDCDIAVTGKLAPLYQMPLNGNVVAMAMEPTVNALVKAQVGLAKEDPYHNSGVLLIDLPKWRAFNAEKKLIDLFEKSGGSLCYADQDLLNGVFKGAIMPIAPTYNFFTTFRYYRYRTLVNKLPAYRFFSKDAYNAARKNPTVIHYLGAERPWLRGNLNPYRKIYHQYLQKTPYANMPLKKGKECYLFLFHMMEWLTVICPPLRFWISDKWGHKIK